MTAVQWLPNQCTADTRSKVETGANSSWDDASMRIAAAYRRAALVHPSLDGNFCPLIARQELELCSIAVQPSAPYWH